MSGEATAADRGTDGVPGPRPDTAPRPDAATEAGTGATGPGPRPPRTETESDAESDAGSGAEHGRRPGGHPGGRSREGTGRKPDAGPRPVALPVGRNALLIELPGPEAAEGFHAEVLRRRAAGLLPGVTEIVPGARTVLLDGLADPRRFAAEVPQWEVPPLVTGGESAVEIPVRYDGPDLEDVAAMWGVTPEEVGRVHAAASFRVAFCGFAPGFGYLTGLPERYHVRRRPDPRTKVPAGSVALAGPYTGVYPRSSPGGWQLIGTAVDTVLWDTGREPAALFSPGTRVRFVPEGGGSR